MCNAGPTTDHGQLTIDNSLKIAARATNTRKGGVAN